MNGIKHSIRHTTDNRAVAVVDEDILKDIDTGTWNKETKEKAKKAAKTVLLGFRDGIEVNGVTAKINKTSRREYAHSNYTEALYSHDSDTFGDKMRAASVADDVVHAATDWQRDGGLKHDREDNIVDFDKGKTLVMVGDRKYEAEVQLAITKQGEYLLYDVVDIQPANFEMENETLSAPEFARYDKTGNGVTTLAESGEEIRIESVVEAKEGELTFRLADGREVSSSEVTYGSSAEAELYAEFARSELQPGVMAAAIRQYDGSVSPKAYVRGMETAYLYGWAGISPKEVASLPQTAALNEVQRSFAYDLGRVRAIDEDTKKSTKLKSLVESSRKKSNGKKGRVILEGVDSRGRLTERQKASKGFCETAAKILGVNIHLYESDVLDGVRGYTKQDGNRITDNGFYDPQTGDIWLDINAGTDGRGLTVFTLAHELAHFVRQWSPEKFRVLSDFLMETYGKKGVSVEDLVSAQQSYAKEQGRDLTFREAWEEVVADSMEMLLNDGRVMERVAALKKRDGTLADKIIGYIRRFVDRVQKAYDGITADSAEGKTVAGWGKEEIEGLQDRFADALYDASETFKKTDVSQMETSDGVKHRFRGISEDGKKIYESNFPKGTPKSAKSNRILDYIQNVWSKKPISLVISNGETSRTILAQFDPTVDEGQNTPTDASKLAGGNRHGTHSEQRVTLDLADDYYEIASEANYNYSKLETGKESETHTDVKMWHYFVNDIYFAEYGETEATPYTVTINVKEKDSGDFVYSFNAEKESSTRRTLHAAVNTRKGANGELFLNDIVSQSDPSVNIQDAQNSEKHSTRREGMSARRLLEGIDERAITDRDVLSELRAYKEASAALDAAEARYTTLKHQTKATDPAEAKTQQEELERAREAVNGLKEDLYRMELGKALTDILYDAKQEAAKKAKATAEKRVQEAEDRRDRTVMRDKIKKKETAGLPQGIGG